MQKVKLPKQLDPFKSAMKRSDYQGVLMAKDMIRLTEAVADIDDTIAVAVRFDKDAQGLNFFQGTLSTSVSLICQRCSEPFAHQIHVEFCFSPVQGTDQNEIDELPDGYDPVEVNDHGEIDIIQLFEDELLLSLPIVALHAEKDCKIGQDDMQYGDVEPDVERPNPFAVLKELKRD
ncbi:23S rRNA accumulation protein YceD [Aestuariibacter halophilus]|uniref:Large ribosomal RNA subunit accumulation protein YceD n=1 Tax=Fluctibacter halophilus TaxID=226011 RepID=A0ABS8G4W8_9ALTE|nr:23S rRNA accumulation protein YceD [Aestuariibacter halophilus]MCC2615627.1 23S rRNA accumulation protein YceD [Aestuariibacter halophilus]